VYRLLTAGLAAIGLLATASRAAADITWVERGDAGGLPATAQITEGDRFQPLTAITGTIAGNRDADMFQIFISDPSKFSATTVGTPGTLTDSQLFLFDADGKGVYFNDDASSNTHHSTLPAGDPHGPKTPGLYYLLITPFDLDPVGPGGLPIFPHPGASNRTGVFGPNVFAGNLLEITGFEVGPGGLPADQNYTYTINLTGAEVAVPEPTTLLALGLGLAGLAGYRWRRAA
jgi:hypothetical protein